MGSIPIEATPGARSGAPAGPVAEGGVPRSSLS
jgi:hypothetical protein